MNREIDGRRELRDWHLSVFWHQKLNNKIGNLLQNFTLMRNRFSRNYSLSKQIFFGYRISSNIQHRLSKKRLSGVTIKLFVHPLSTFCQNILVLSCCQGDCLGDTLHCKHSSQKRSRIIKVVSEIFLYFSCTSRFSLFICQVVNMSARNCQV